MFTPKSMLFLLIYLTLGWSADQAFADLVHLTNGGVLEGKASREDEMVHVEMPCGRVTIPASKVDHIVTKATPLDEFKSRFAAIDQTAQTASADLSSLAQWCESQGLKRQAEQCHFDAIRIDPDNEVSRERLGFVRYQDAWMTEEESRKAMGFVRHKDTWVTPEAKADLLQLEAQERLDKAKAEMEQIRLARAEAEAQEARAKAEAARAEAEVWRNRYVNRYSTVFVHPRHRHSSPCDRSAATAPGDITTIGTTTSLGVPTIRADGSTALTRTTTSAIGLRAPTVSVLR